METLDETFIKATAFLSQTNEKICASNENQLAFYALYKQVILLYNIKH